MRRLSIGSRGPIRTVRGAGNTGIEIDATPYQATFHLDQLALAILIPRPMAKIALGEQCARAHGGKGAQRRAEHDGPRGHMVHRGGTGKRNGHR